VLAIGACTGFEAEVRDAAGLDDAGDLAEAADSGRPDLAKPPDLSASSDLSAAEDLSVADDLAGVDLAGVDLSPAADLAPVQPADFVCHEPWTVGAARTEAACKSRQVVVIEPGVADPQGISIAHTQAGRVAIAYEYPNGADSSELHLALFDGASLPSPSAAPITVLDDGPMDRVGVRSALASSGTDTLHLAFLEVTDLGNTIWYCQPGACQGSNWEQVASNFSSSAELAMVAGSDVTVAAFNANTGNLATYKRGAPWGSSKLIKSAIDTAAAGAGQVRLALDTSGLPVAAFHYTQAVGLAQPRASEFDGMFWSTSKTLDNNPPTALSGFSIGLALFGTQHYATYFQQSSVNTVELRLASWKTTADTPDVSVLLSALPVADFGNPLHRAALAVDKFGLLHLAVIEPQSPTGGVLEYRRQIVVGGSVKWIADIIDDVAVGSGDSSQVDLVVDDNGRPHIAYFNQATGNVVYATRFDR
jgi:hypothetical protein